MGARTLLPPVGGTFFLPTYESPGARAVDTPLKGEIVLDPFTGSLVLGDGVTQGGKTVGGAGQVAPGIPFVVQGQITSAAAGTAIVLIPDSVLGPAQKVYVTGWLLTVGGGTAWTDATATIVKLQDSAAVALITWAKAGLTGNAALVVGTGSTTLAAAFTAQSGLSAGKGLQIVGDANFAAGSTIQVAVMGYIK